MVDGGTSTPPASTPTVVDGGTSTPPASKPTVVDGGTSTPPATTPTVVDGGTSTPPATTPAVADAVASPSPSPRSGSETSDKSSVTTGTAIGATGTSNGVAKSQDQRIVTYEDISVSLVRQAKSQANGLVTVLVPQEIITSGKEFAFKLPEKIVDASSESQSIRVTAASGGPLPDWLKFDPGSQTLSSLSSANRVFPVKLLIFINKKRADLIISERTNQN